MRTDQYAHEFRGLGHRVVALPVSVRVWGGPRRLGGKTNEQQAPRPIVKPNSPVASNLPTRVGRGAREENG